MTHYMPTKPSTKPPTKPPTKPRDAQVRGDLRSRFCGCSGIAFFILFASLSTAKCASMKKREGWRTHSGVGFYLTGASLMVVAPLEERNCDIEYCSRGTSFVDGWRE
jgi:hypothetical protein